MVSSRRNISGARPVHLNMTNQTSALSYETLHSSKRIASEVQRPTLEDYVALHQASTRQAQLESHVVLAAETVTTVGTANEDQLASLIVASDLAAVGAGQVARAASIFATAIGGRMADGRDAEETILDTLENNQNPAAKAILDQIQQRGGLKRGLDTLRAYAEATELFHTRTRDVVESSSPETILQDLDAHFAPGRAMLATLRLEALSYEELKETLKNRIDTARRAVDDAYDAYRKGGPWTAYRDALWIYEQETLGSLCESVWLYTRDVPPPFLDPNPDYTKRLEQVLRELGIDCPKYVQAPSMSWVYWLTSLFIALCWLIISIDW